MLIISLGITGLLKLHNTLKRTNANFKQSIQAINIARNKIETLRNYTSITAYNNLVSLNNTTNWLPAAATGDNTTFTGTLYVTSYNSPSYLLVDVIVNWTDNVGLFQQIELTSIIAPIDPSIVGDMLV